MKNKSMKMFQEIVYHAYALKYRPDGMDVRWYRVEPNGDLTVKYDDAEQNSKTVVFTKADVLGH